MHPPLRLAECDQHNKQCISPVMLISLRMSDNFTLPISSSIRITIRIYSKYSGYYIK